MLDQEEQGTQDVGEGVASIPSGYEDHPYLFHIMFPQILKDTDMWIHRVLQYVLIVNLSIRENKGLRMWGKGVASIPSGYEDHPYLWILKDTDMWIHLVL